MSLDGVIAAAAGAMYNLDGAACTIMRPHTLRRVPVGDEITELLVKTQAEEDDTSLVLELASSARFEGEIPSGLVLVLAATNYTVQAAATVAKATKQITVTISPAIAAQALVGAAVAVPSSVSWVGTSTAAPRYMEETVSAAEAVAMKAEVGTRLYGIEKGALSIELEAGPRGDYIEIDGSSVGRVSRVVDSTPEDWTVICE